MSTPSGAGPQTVRAFVAIELPPPMLSALAQLQQELRARGGNYVRWTNPEGIHLTLAFLGEVRASLVDTLVPALEQACAPVPPFSLGLGTAGAFPSVRSPRVLWVGLAGHLDSLALLQRRVAEALRPLGFPPEARGFSPHLTLGRVREGTPPVQRQRLGEALAFCTIPQPPLFTVDGVSLMRSQLTPQGAIYSRLHRVELQPPAARYQLT
ncbi:MAG: RNA 2',3'-cyclic phosphodiesterase [Chloroflexi bacterium]|nr:RNA 2',3'-cyclic phosphodiesterase [Chloroflexota bacterium]